MSWNVMNKYTKPEGCSEYLMSKESPTHHRSDKPLYQLLWKAYVELDAGRPHECLKILRSSSDELTGAAVASIRFTACGLLAELRGETERASHFFDRAYHKGAPYSAVLLACGEHYLRRNDHEQAYMCYSLVGRLKTDSFRIYWSSLPIALKLRYAPWVVHYMPDEVKSVFSEVLGKDCADIVWHLMLARGGAKYSDATILPNEQYVTPGNLGILKAYEELAQGRFERSLEILHASEYREHPLGKAVRWVAEGALASRRGDFAEMRESFEAAYALGIPLPVLLRHCGEYLRFLDKSSFHAYECHSLLDQLDSDLSLTFWRELPRNLQRRYAPIVLPRLLHAPMPPMYVLQAIKRQIVKEFGEFGAEVLYADILYQNSLWQVTRVSLMCLHDYAREFAINFEELIPPREVMIPSPRIYGKDYGRGINGKTRSVYLCVLSDVVVSSKSNLLFTRDYALLDCQGDELSRIPYSADVNPLVVVADEQMLSVLRPIEPSLRVESALSLVGNHTHNYGHWIVEFMFQIWACMDRTGFDTLPIIVDAQMPSQLRELLEFFIGATHPIIVLEPGESIHVNQLWTCSKVSYWPGGEAFPIQYYDDYVVSDMQALRNILARLQPVLNTLECDGNPEKLYLTRSSTQARPFVNREEVESFFRNQGYAVLNFNEVPMLEQLRYMRTARTIVIEAGSSIYGVMFCRSGTHVGELPSFEPTEREWCAGLFKELGHEFLMLPCQMTSDGICADLSILPDYLSCLESMGAISSEDMATMAVTNQ